MKKILDFINSYRMFFLWSIVLFITSIFMMTLNDFYLSYCPHSALIGGFVGLSISFLFQGISSWLEIRKSKNMLNILMSNLYSNVYAMQHNSFLFLCLLPVYFEEGHGEKLFKCLPL